MPTAVASKFAVVRGNQPRGRKLTRAEINGRLQQIELATVSALRALQMDIYGEEGTSSATVIKRAWAHLR